MLPRPPAAVAGATSIGSRSERANAAVLGRIPMELSHLAIPASLINEAEQAYLAAEAVPTAIPLQPQPTSIAELVELTARARRAAAGEETTNVTAAAAKQPLTPTSLSLAQAKARKKRAAIAQAMEEEQEEFDAMALAARVLPSAFVGATSEHNRAATRAKERRNASFITSAFANPNHGMKAVTAMGLKADKLLHQPTPPMQQPAVLPGFEGGTSKGVKFYTREEMLSGRTDTDAGKDDEEEKSDQVPSSLPSERPKYRSRRLSLAEAFDPSALPNSPTGTNRPSLATSITTQVRDEALRKVLESHREEEDRLRRDQHGLDILETPGTLGRALTSIPMSPKGQISRVASIPLSPSSKGQAAANAANKAALAAALASSQAANSKDAQGAGAHSSQIVIQPQQLTQAELEQQVLDEWTSSDEDDIHIDESFKEQTILSRTTRRKFGLKSMREVMNLLSKPLSKREYPLQEYEQSGAFQAVEYWPEEGRFSKMILKDSNPKNENLLLANPRLGHSTGDRIIAEVTAPYLKHLQGPSGPERGTIAHARHQSLHLFAQQIEKTLDVEDPTIVGPSVGGHSRGTSAQAAAGHTRDTSSLGGASGSLLTVPGAGHKSKSPSLRSATSDNAPVMLDEPSSDPTPHHSSQLSSELTHAFAMLDPSVMNQTEQEALAIFLRKSIVKKKKEAISLYAAAQAAPFVKLRRDLEEDPAEGGAAGGGKKKDAFQRYLANDHPLLSDSQIDRLLAEKIDESVRKGYPRNRAELRGLAAKGAVSFGLPRTISTKHDGATLAVERDLQAYIATGGMVADTIQGMFHDDREMRKQHKQRNMLVMNRPYSARSAVQRKEIRLVQTARANTKALVHETPPVGAYNPSYTATSRDLDIPAPELGLQSARDQVPFAGLAGGLGKEAHALKPSNLSNLKRASNQIPSSGPGPADTQVTRWLDHDDILVAAGGSKNKSNKTNSMRPGSAFSMADIGKRTAIMSSTGIAKQAIANPNSLAFSSIQLSAKEIVLEPEPYIPLRMSKIPSYIGEGPKVSFTSSLQNDRQSVTGGTGLDSAIHGIFVASQGRGRHVLQYASTDLTGPQANLPHARKSVPISFPKAPRKGMEVITTVREDKKQRDKRQAERKKLEAESRAIAATQKAEAKLKKQAKEEKFREELAQRDAEYLASTTDRRLTTPNK